MSNPTDTATIKNGKLFVIQYRHYAKSPKCQTYLQLFQKMVDSFQIIMKIEVRKDVPRSRFILRLVEESLLQSGSKLAGAGRTVAVQGAPTISKE